MLRIINGKTVDVCINICKLSHTDGKTRLTALHSITSLRFFPLLFEVVRKWENKFPPWSLRHFHVEKVISQRFEFEKLSNSVDVRKLNITHTWAPAGSKRLEIITKQLWSKSEPRKNAENVVIGSRRRKSNKSRHGQVYVFFSLRDFLSLTVFFSIRACLYCFTYD